MKTTKEERKHWRTFVERIEDAPTRGFVRALLDDIDEAEARASKVESELAECRAELENAVKCYRSFCAKFNAADGARQAAEARAERLREAIVAALNEKHDGAVRDSLRAALAETAQKKTSAATGEGARPVDHAPVKPSRPADGGPIEPGTSSPDEVERAAREWIDDSASVAASLFENGPPTEERVTATLSALRRQERLDVARHVPTLNDLDDLCAQAREAGRVEGWNEAVDALLAAVSRIDRNYFIRSDARDDLRNALKRPHRAKRDQP